VNLFLLAASTNAPAIPANLGHWNGRPVWIDAESVVDSSGRLNAGLLGEQTARMSAELARRNSRAVAHARGPRSNSAEGVDECQVFKSWSTEHFQSTATLEELVANAETIVSGTVVAQRQGIFYNTPGTLLRIDAEYLKGHATPSTYLFYPYGRIKTAEGMLCSRPFNDNESAPRIGDRFLAFSITPAYVADGVTILAPDPRRELLHEAAEGKLTLPSALRSANASPGSFDAIHERVRTGLLKAGR
jgi:hypothetical protein